MNLQQYSKDAINDPLVRKIPVILWEYPHAFALLDR
jgi:hypothetical protein